MAVLLTGLVMLAQVVGVDVVPEADLDPETAALAEQVGLDPVALQGAVQTTHSTPRTYLVHEGLLEPPRPTAPPVTNLGLWDRLAACESSGIWNRNSGNGYFGGLQFDRQTWLGYGGGAYASSAHLASKAQQIAVAERLRAARGMAPWPVCGRRV